MLFNIYEHELVEIKKENLPYIVSKQKKQEIILQISLLCCKQKYSKILLTSLIKNLLFMDQLSSLEINPQTKMLLLLDFSRKKEPMLTIQPATFLGELIEMSLVPHDMTIFTWMEALLDLWLATAHFPLGLLQF